MALKKSTIQKLELMKACILQEPELYDQGEYPNALQGHTCNTPCCLAGWAAWVLDPNIKRYNERLRRGNHFDSMTMARDLEITIAQADRLFLYWPDLPNGERNPAWGKPKTPASAKAAAERIDQFIESKGAI